MNFDKKTIVLIFGFYLISNLIFSQVGYEPYLQEALDKNEKLKAINQAYLVELAQVNQSNVLPNPEITIGFFSPQMNAPSGIDWFRLGGMQSFPWFGTLKAKKTLVEKEAEIKRQDVFITGLEVTFQVKKLWLEIYEIEKKKEILESKLLLLEKLSETTISVSSIGQITADKTLDVLMKIETVKSEIALLENKKKNSTCCIQSNFTK